MAESKSQLARPPSVLKLGVIKEASSKDNDEADDDGEDEPAFHVRGSSALELEVEVQPDASDESRGSPLAGGGGSGGGGGGGGGTGRRFSGFSMGSSPWAFRRLSSKSSMSGSTGRRPAASSGSTGRRAAASSSSSSNSSSGGRPGEEFGSRFSRAVSVVTGYSALPRDSVLLLPKDLTKDPSLRCCCCTCPANPFGRCCGRCWRCWKSRWCRYRLLCWSEIWWMRLIWKTVAVFLACWTFYALVVGFDLLKFKFDCSGGSDKETECFKLVRLSVSDLCGLAETVNGTKRTRMQIAVEAQVNSPSFSPINIKGTTLALSLKDGPGEGYGVDYGVSAKETFLNTTFDVAFKNADGLARESDQLAQGTNTLTIDTNRTYVTHDEQLAAVLFAYLNKEQLDVGIKLHTMVSTMQLILFPVTVPISLELTYKCRKINCPQSGKVSAWYGCAMDRVPTCQDAQDELETDGANGGASTTLDAVRLGRDGNFTGSEPAASSPGVALGLNVSMGIAGSPFVARLPSLSLDLYLSLDDESPATFGKAIDDGSRPLIATSTIKPFDMEQGNPTPLDIGVLMPGPVDQTRLGLLQSSVARITGTDPGGNSDLFVFLKGTTGSTDPGTQQQQCLLQRVLTFHVPWKLPLTGKTEKADSRASGGSASSSSSSSSFALNGVELFGANAVVSAGENTSSPFNSSRSLTFAANLTMPFVVHGDLPPMSLDFLMAPTSNSSNPAAWRYPAQTVARVETQPIKIDFVTNDATQQPLLVLVDVELGNMTYIVTEAAQAKAVDDLGLRVTGSAGVNLLSDVLRGFRANLTSAEGDQAAAAIANKIHAAAPQLELDLNVSSTPTTLDVAAHTRVAKSPLPFYVRVGNLSCEIVLPDSPSASVRLSLPSFELPGSTTTFPASSSSAGAAAAASAGSTTAGTDIIIAVHAKDTESAPGLRGFVADMAAGRRVPLRVQGGTVQREGYVTFHENAQGDVSIDFVSLSDLIPAAGGGTNNASSEAPLLAVHSLEMAGLMSAGEPVDVSCLLSGECVDAKAIAAQGKTSSLALDMNINGSVLVPLLSGIKGQLRMPAVGVFLERLSRPNQTTRESGERLLSASINGLTYDRTFLLPVAVSMDDVPTAASALQAIMNGPKNVTVRARMDPSVNLLSALFADLQLYEHTFSPAAAVSRSTDGKNQNNNNEFSSSSSSSSSSSNERSSVSITVAATEADVAVTSLLRFPFPDIGFALLLGQTELHLTNEAGEAIAAIKLDPIAIGSDKSQAKGIPTGGSPAPPSFANVPFQIEGTVANRRPFALVGRRLVTEAGRAVIGLRGSSALVQDASSRKIIAANFSMVLSSLLEGLGIVSDSSSSTPTSPSSSPSPAAFTNNGVQFVGGATPGSEMDIPCLIPAICPATLPTLASPSMFSLLGNFSLDFELIDIDINVTEPLWAQADCCIHEPLVSLRVAPFHLTSSAPFTLVPLLVELTDPQAIKNAIGDLTGGMVNTTFRIHGQRDRDLLSAMFSEVEILLPVPATRDPNSPSGKATAYSPGTAVPGTFADEWYLPLYSVGAWYLTGTDSLSAQFDVKIVELPNPAPWELVFASTQIDMMHAGRKVGQVIPAASGGDLRLMGTGSGAAGKTNLTANLVIMGEDPVSAECAARSDQANQAMCNVADVISAFIGRKAMNVTWVISFTNVLGQRVRGSMPTLFFDDYWKQGPASRLEDPALADADATQDFANIVSGAKVDYLDSAWETLIKSGVTAKLQIGIHNVFSFPLEISSYVVDFLYQDPTGEYLSYLPKSYGRKFDIVALRGVGDSGFAMEVEPGKSSFSPQKQVNVKDNIVEHGCRIYNAAVEQKHWCASVVNGKLGLAIHHPSDPSPGFRFSQAFEVPQITIIGDDDCVYQPLDGCLPDTVPVAAAANLANFGVIKDAALKSGNLVLTDGRDETGAAYLSSKVRVVDGFIATFSFKVETGSWSAGSANGLVFVVQNVGAQAVGQSCSTGICHGYKSLGTASFGVVINTYMANGVYVFKGGDTDNRLGYSANAAGASGQANDVDDGKSHTMRVIYDRNRHKVFVYLDDMTSPPIIAAMACSYLTISTSKPCIDVSAIADPTTGEAWVGLVATSGTLSYSTHTVTSFSFDNVKTVASKSFVTESGTVQADAG